MKKYITTLKELSELSGNVLLKYPNHSDDWGELIPANILFRLINLYPNGYNEKLIIKDYNSNNITLINIINDMNSVAETFGFNINNMFNNKYFYPAIPITEEPVDWDDSFTFKYNTIIKNKGYVLYYVPYEQCEIRNWWNFD